MAGGFVVLLTSCDTLYRQKLAYSPTDGGRSVAVGLNTTSMLDNYATEAGYSHNRLDCRLREDRGSNPEVGDVKASVAAVEFILTSSSRHDVEEDVLSSELQQLGLPREHSTSLVRVYSDNLAAFTSKLKSESLRFSRLEDVRWRVDFVSRSSRHYIDPDIPEPEVTISLRVWDSLAGQHKMHKFTTTGDMVALLLEGCGNRIKVFNICLHCWGGLYDNTGRPEIEDEDVDDIEELDAQQSFWHSSFEEGDCEDDSRHTNERSLDTDQSL
uniref:COMM domain-containing protein n=1 Tax=Timema shepardi TaxID=629360 RepID=A0A7R9ASA4_TIMSH|nr:unnamed protein product [Timema shepardi]